MTVKFCSFVSFRTIVTKLPSIFVGFLQVINTNPQDGKIIKQGQTVTLTCTTNINWFFCIWRSPGGSKQCAIQQESLPQVPIFLIMIHKYQYFIIFCPDLCTAIRYIDRVPYFYQKLKTYFSYLHADIAAFLSFLDSLSPFQ